MDRDAEILKLAKSDMIKDKVRKTTMRAKAIPKSKRPAAESKRQPTKDEIIAMNKLEDEKVAHMRKEMLLGEKEI